MSWRVITEDAATALRSLPPASFDACLCDPPYGLSFMGKRWDYDVPTTALWAEVLRVLKPGAPLLALFGTRTYHRGVVRIEDAGFEIRDQLAWMHGQGMPKSKSCLKPAFEPIVLARKPLEGTAKQSLSKWGCGGNFNDCRTPEGRWPANVLLDEDAAAMLDEQTKDQIHSAGAARNKVVTGTYAATSFDMGGTRQMNRFGDAGGASRFFYTAKASKAERGDGNDHPTVKPIALTTYLARLLRPENPGAILVPFSGSGSEMIGALRAGWPTVIGIEREEAYAATAERRLMAERCTDSATKVGGGT